MSEKSKTGAVKAGFICLILADLGIGIFGFFSFLITGPFCLASFILSLIGIGNGATKSGLLLLILTLITPVLMLGVWFLLLGIGLSYSQSGNIPGLP
jgi:uncharacterized membrane protein YwaF